MIQLEQNPKLGTLVDSTQGCVPEGTVTNEVRKGLFKLGCIPKEWKNDNV
jgi:hypothetical protein